MKKSSVQMSRKLTLVAPNLRIHKGSGLSFVIKNKRLPSLIRPLKQIFSLRGMLQPLWAKYEKGILTTHTPFCKRSLETLLKQIKQGRDKQLNQNFIWSLLKRSLRALGSLHQQGLPHCNLKLSNLFVEQQTILLDDPVLYHPDGFDYNKALSMDLTCLGGIINEFLSISTFSPSKQLLNFLAQLTSTKINTKPKIEQLLRNDILREPPRQEQESTKPSKMNMTQKSTTALKQNKLKGPVVAPFEIKYRKINVRRKKLIIK